jgi:hypothetical protein
MVEEDRKESKSPSHRWCYRHALDLDEWITDEGDFLAIIPVVVKGMATKR